MSDKTTEKTTAADATEPEHHNGPGRSDTRTRIQQVALELFVNQGYEKTSLREIAEQLGVTKAALYYHFKTKEEIVESTVEDYLRSIDGLLEWGKTQPRTIATRQEVLRRYSKLLEHGQGSMKFFQQNPAQGAELGQQFRSRMTALFDLVRDPESPITDQIRSILAVAGQMFSMVLASKEFELPGGPLSEADVRAAALEVGLSLLQPSSPAAPAS